MLTSKNKCYLLGQVLLDAKDCQNIGRVAFSRKNKKQRWHNQPNQYQDLAEMLWDHGKAFQEL